MQSNTQDIIRVRDRLLNIALCSGSRWPAKGDQGTLQPISLSADIFFDTAPSGTTDSLDLSINYSSISKKLGTALTGPNQSTFRSLEEVAHRALAVVQGALTDVPVTEINIKVIQLKAPLHCKDVGIEVRAARGRGGWACARARHFVTDFVCPTIVGVNDVERVEEQDVVVNISIETLNTPLDRVELDFRLLTRALWKGIGKTSYLTLEALTSYAAQETLAVLSGSFGAETNPSVTVAVAKPCALVYADASEVQITRNKDAIKKAIRPEPTELRTAVLALGSNLGDRFHNIEHALRLLEEPSRFASEADLKATSQVIVVNTSFLYETAPMYVTDQPAFINGACMIETDLEALELLRLLKAIEPAVGRTPTIQNGPRVVDLDIIFYDDLVMDTRPKDQRSTLDHLKGELVIPHPRLPEREFVLRPLNDMIPGYIHPLLGRSVSHLLNQVPRNEDDPPMLKVLPFPNLPVTTHDDTKPPPTLTYWTHPLPPTSTRPSAEPNPKPKTRIMATLNVTPDSFSDGSDHNSISTALPYVEHSVTAGADIIDIGGYSTRPGAEFVSAKEEGERVTPIIQAIRTLANGTNEVTRTIPISIDTFRWEVAEEAIHAGANVINDVYAFTGPKSLPGAWQTDEEALETMQNMKRVARKFTTPVVLMHSRGDAGQDKDYSAYAYAEKSDTSAIIEGVRIELGDKVERIIKGKGGLRRWLVVADPGIGFSKTVGDNLELLRNGSKVVEDTKIGNGGSQGRNPLAGLPTLVGTSRKSFIGALFSKAQKGRETTPKDRGWATAAGVACAIQQGAMVVRVHDVKEMGDVVIMADALWP